MGRHKKDWKPPMFDPETGEVFSDESMLQIDPELVENIDLDSIDKASTDAATIMLRDLSEVYFNEQFMSDHPELKKRLGHELESLRILIKMRKSDEQIHDINMRAITNHPENASLYRSLSQIQTSLLSIQRQIDETVKTITGVLKTVQVETLEEEEEQPEGGEHQTIRFHRGSKSFIEQMKQQKQEG